MDCGLEPRIASEREDAGEVRVIKIKRLIKNSLYSIHDISRMDALKKGEYPRFNMPFELGLDLGCRDFGSGSLKEKICLIMEREKFRYRKVISDLSGNDIKSHNNEPEQLIREVRKWIQANIISDVKSGTKIWRRFNEFAADFEETCDALEIDAQERESMSTVEYIYFVKEWLKYN
jgi:hypothetical protein